MHMKLHEHFSSSNLQPQLSVSDSEKSGKCDHYHDLAFLLPCKKMCSLYHHFAHNCASCHDTDMFSSEEGLRIRAQNVCHDYNFLFLL